MSTSDASHTRPRNRAGPYAGMMIAPCTGPPPAGPSLSAASITAGSARSKQATRICVSSPRGASCACTAATSSSRDTPSSTIAPTSVCRRATASASSSWSPQATSTDRPLPSTVRMVGRDTNSERDSLRTHMPCVTSKSCPLNAADSSLPRNTQVFATSVGVGKVRPAAGSCPARLSDINPVKFVAVVPGASPRIVSIVANTAWIRSERMGPGYSVFTRMPRSPSSNDSWRDSAFSAAFGTTYGDRA